MLISAIIPARYGASRFPGKLLAPLAGKPIIQWVYEAAQQCPLIDQTIIATDHELIYKAAKLFGAEVQMTSVKHKTGTDRIAEVAERMNTDIVVNLQGDEPFMEGRIISLAIEPFLHDQSLVMSTLKTYINSSDDLLNPNIVKVVTDRYDFALYFSRSSIPYLRDISFNHPNIPSQIYKHIGLYVYQKDFLLRFARLPQTPLEKAEKLEQLRALENGYKIKVINCTYQGIGIDTPEDLQKAETLVRQTKVKQTL
jgi:3-deoxy-manno-octulosonate cytidylyltransferase (CMP-KDO synthetase)